MPTPFTRRFGVLMDNDEPFEFDWDKEEEPTQTEVRDLWKKSLEDQTLALTSDQLKPLEQGPFVFKTPEQNLMSPSSTTPPPVEEEPGILGQAWDKATTSFLPDRKSADTALPGLQTLSRAGDWVYSRLAQPAATPLGIATIPLAAASAPVRAGLALAGTGMGAYGLTESVPRAYNEPTLENVADVGMNVAETAGFPLGYKMGAFNRKPNFDVLGADVEMPPTIDVTQRRMYPQQGTRGLALEAQNPLGMGGPPSAEVIPPGPVSRLARPVVREAAALESVDIGPEAAQRMYPTVGGTGLSNIQALSKAGKPKPGERNRLPRVGGVGEMGIRGEPMFPAIPERVQTSTNQELFRGVTEMLTRMAQQGKRTTAQPVLSVTSVVEDIPNASNETYFNDRMLRERAAGDEVLPPQVLTDYRPKLNKKGEVTGTGKLFEENPNYPNKPVEPTLPEVETVSEGRPQPTVDPATQPWGPHRFERKPDVVDKALADAVRKWAGKAPEVAQAAGQTAAERRAKLKEDAKATAADLGMSGWTQLERMGPGGDTLRRFMQRVRADAKVKSNTLTKQYRDVDKLTDAQMEHVVDVIEGNAKLNDQSLASVVPRIKAALRDSGIIAERSGLKMYDKEGNAIPFKRMEEGYFPHKFKPGHFNIDSLINKLLKENPKMTPDQAKFIVDEGITKGERAISPQHMRTLNLQGYEKTKKAFFEHIQDLVERSYEAEKYGEIDTADPNSYLSQLIAKTENPEKAMEIVNRQLGRTPKNTQYESVAHAINTGEAASKLGMFAINNLNQGAGIGMRANLSSTARGLAQAMKGVSAEETGALSSSLSNTLYDTGQNKAMRTMSQALGWNKSENFLRNWAAHAGKADAERLFTALKKDPTNPTNRAKLDSLLLEDIDTVLGQKKLTPEQTSRAGFRMSEMTQGLVDPADLPPLWSSSPLMKVPLMFKRYAFQQTKQLKNLWNDNKTPKDKAVMLGKLVTLYTAMGEVTGDITTAAKAGISETAGLARGEDFDSGDIVEAVKNRGKKTGSQSELDKTISSFYKKGGIDEDKVNRLLEDMGGSYMLGLVGQIAGDAGSTNAAARLANTTVGPAIGDVFALTEAANRSMEGESLAPLGRTIVQRAAPFGYPIAEGLFPKKKKAPKGLGIAPSMPKVKSFF